MKINTQIFKEQMFNKQPNIEVLGEYLGDKSKIKVRCKICGHEWEDSPTHLKQGRGCSKCKKQQKLKILEKDFIKRCSEKHNNKYDYSMVKYVNQHTIIDIICPIHGIFHQEAQSHLRGRNCPKCAHPSKAPILSEFIEKANKVHGKFYDYSKVNYINSKTPIIIICPKHGDFYQTPDKHIQGAECPKCQLKSQTKLYEKLKESFPNEEILFEVNNKIIPWLGLQRFDIYFPKYNIAIEYNGIQHYVEVEHFGGKIGLSETKKRDELKRQKCKDNNCILFEVKYDYTEEDYCKLEKDIKNIISYHQ